VEYKRRNVNSYLVRGISLCYAAERLLSNEPTNERTNERRSKYDWGIERQGRINPLACATRARRAKRIRTRERAKDETRKEEREPRTAVRGPGSACTPCPRGLGSVPCRRRAEPANLRAASTNRVASATSTRPSAPLRAVPKQQRWRSSAPARASRCRATQGCRDPFCPAVRAVNTRCVHIQCLRSKDTAVYSRL